MCKIKYFVCFESLKKRMLNVGKLNICNRWNGCNSDYSSKSDYQGSFCSIYLFQTTLLHIHHYTILEDLLTVRVLSAFCLCWYLWNTKLELMVKSLIFQKSPLLMISVCGALQVEKYSAKVLLLSSLST